MAPRPPSEFNLVQSFNGSVTFLGVIVSTGAVQNNASTAQAFSTTPLGPIGSDASPQNLAGTLAGKVLLLQASAAGFILPSAFSNLAVNGVPGGVQKIAALQATIPVATGTAPGVALAAGERVVVTMGTGEGWLQWLPLSGAANLFVWEQK